MATGMITLCMVGAVSSPGLVPLAAQAYSSAQERHRRFAREERAERVAQRSRRARLAAAAGPYTAATPLLLSDRELASERAALLSRTKRGTQGTTPSD